MKVPLLYLNTQFAFNFYKLLEAAEELFIIFKDIGLNSHAIRMFKLGKARST